jgi:PAS domain S-box-containing protein
MKPDNKGTVLIVDDEAPNLGILFECLRRANFKVLIAEDGASALKRVERIVPDIVLLDIKLPDMDGFEVCRRLKEFSDDISVIFLTALTDIEDKIRGLELNAADYITKPFHSREVLARLERHLTLKNLQKQIEEHNVRLREEIAERTRIQETLTAILDTSPVGIGLVKGERMLDWGNDTMYRMLGYEQNTLRGQNAAVLYPDRDEYERVGREIYKQTGGSGQGYIETRWIRKDGTIFDCCLQTQALDTNDLSKGWIIAATDITARKRAEEALKKAKEAAETASHSKSLFLANMSHELRTPLNIILGYTQILQQGNECTQEAKKYLDTISQSSSHLLTLLTDILEISKIANHTIELFSYEIHLPQFLNQVTAFIRIQCREKGLAFEYEADPHLPVIIEADGKRLRQVLLNLLGNAVKFTDNGKISLRVSVGDCGLTVGSCNRQQTTNNSQQTTHNSQQTIRFEIEDTGAGISPDQLDKIFLPFEQIRNDSHWHEGIGKGLAISNYLIRLMGGKINVRTDVGKGSIFWFDLPVPVITDLSEDRKSASEPKTDKNNIPETEIIPPPQKELDKLYQWAALGFMKRIEEYAACFEEKDRKYRPFSVKLRELAANFEDEKLMHFLEKYMEGSLVK